LAWRIWGRVCVWVLFFYTLLNPQSIKYNMFCGLHWSWGDEEEKGPWQLSSGFKVRIEEKLSDSKFYGRHEESGSEQRKGFVHISVA
jgi:hypothetical protein